MVSRGKKLDKLRSKRCIICGQHMTEEQLRKGLSICSKACKRERAKGRRIQYYRLAKRRRWEARRFLCRICGKPVKFPRRYCPDHVCSECHEGAIIAKGKCRKCYQRAYRQTQSKRIAT